MRSSQLTKTLHGIMYTTRDGERQRTADHFTKDISEHELEVVLDNGVHRHLRFRKPGTNVHWFELVTWPGHLTISGDMGTFVFARQDDMVHFFANKDDWVPYDYWKEKLVAGDATEFSLDEYKQSVAEQLDEWVNDLREDGAVQSRIDALIAAVKSELLDHHDDVGPDTLHEDLAAFEHDGHEFYDTWEWDLTRFTFHYLWCCRAIAWGVNQYLDATARTATGTKAA